MKEKQEKPLLVKDTHSSQEYELRSVINGLAGASEDDIKKTMEIALDISNYSQQFDYIVVSGGSGKVAKTLLMATEIPAQKIITLDPEENAVVYQQNNAYASSLHRPLEERIRETKLVIENHGLTPNTQASFLIVDDHIDKGEKAKKYAEVFVPAFPDSKISFSAFSALRVVSRSGSLPNLPISLYVPPQIRDDSYDNAQYYISRLAHAASRLNRRSYHRAFFSEETIQVGEEVLRDQLGKLYEAGKQMKQEATKAA